MPAMEVCNRSDDDCDSRIDEGFVVRVLDPVAMSELTAAQPPCTGPSAGLDVCLTATHRWCSSRPDGCYTTGVGFLQAVPGSARIACIGPRASVRGVTWGTVSAASGIAVNSSNIYTRVAQSASNRYCRTEGFEAGIGPVEHSDPMMWIACLPSDVAQYTDIPTSALAARGCNPIATADTLQCQSASDLECRARGLQGGYGPVEWNDTMSAIVCLR
jgi:hypothetical protein